MIDVAVLGLGAMGSRMAHALLRAGYRVTVYNRSDAHSGALSAAGAHIVRTPREAAARGRIVLCMVTDQIASRTIWLKPETGAIAGLGKGAIAIESSTLTPEWMRRLAAAVVDVGAAFLEAPVVGSRAQADACNLVHLVGGEAEILARAKPVLSTLGRIQHLVGPVGDATTLKLALNAYFYAQVAIMGEVMGLLRKALPNSDAAVELFREMPITSAPLRAVWDRMRAQDFAPQLPIHLVNKDFRAIAGLAADVMASLPALESIWAIYSAAEQTGFGDDDIAGVVQQCMADGS